MEVKKKNIFLQDIVETLSYGSNSRPVSHNYPLRESTRVHAQYIQRKLQDCKNQDNQYRRASAIRYREGMYLEFSGAQDHELKFLSLENRQQGIRLLNVRVDDNERAVKATVYVPHGKESYFLQKVNSYAEPVQEGKKPKNNDLVRSIEDIRIAVLESFWIGNRDTIPHGNAAWCEVWLRYSNDIDVVETNFVQCCSAINAEVQDRRLVFPERIVKLVFASRETLTKLITTCEYVAEIRKAPENIRFFDELQGREQEEWTEELLSRTTFDDTNATVCLLDRGLAAAHPLIAPATKDGYLHSVLESWGINDDDGHGTEMAGVALYYNLKEHLESQHSIEIPHKIESVKILPPRGENRVELYGAVTERAVTLAEEANVGADRTICMAVTAPDNNTDDGSPTSWSAAIDSICSGVSGADKKRLFLISAGDVYPQELRDSGFPDANILHGVENPGQSWNALTIGAYSDNVGIETPAFRSFAPVADVGDLSPYSSTSVTWDNKWPVKPEVLFDGGNMATNGEDYTECPDLSILTTNKDYLSRPFSIISATSSAAAQAAWMAAQLYSEYPGIWPETVRALIVHSARWTDKMRAMFCREDTKTKGRNNLLRTCGYGIPDLQRAIQCMDNSVNMIIQGELQPYAGKGMNEMHVHEIPWPKDVLRELGDADAELRVTLSYFVEPGPGEVGWKDRYRYPSHCLRFDVINKDQTVEDFKKRINVKMRGDNKKDKGDGTSGVERWYLGPDNRDVGSIHSDYMQCSAVDLCNVNYVAVFPVVGWWRERDYLGKSNRKARYSLVVSISTPRTDVDLYTPIITQVAAPTEIGVSIESV